MRAIRRFLEAVEEEQVLFPSYPQGRSELESNANGSKTKATATRNGASRVGLGRTTQRSRRQKRPLRHNNKRRRKNRSAATEVHSAEARRLLRKAVLGTRAPQEQTRSGRIDTARRRIAETGGR